MALDMLSLDIVTLGMVVCLNLQDVKRYEAGQIKNVQSQGNSCFEIKKRHQVVAVRETSRYLAVTVRYMGQEISGYSVKPIGKPRGLAK